MIYYSLTTRAVNPGDAESDKKVYAVAQSRETLNLEKIAVHMSSHNSVFSTGTIFGLLTDAERCMTEHLVNGALLDLGTMGKFRITLSSEGAESTEKFTTAHIKSANVRWTPSKKIKKALQDPEYRLMPTLERIDKARKEMREFVDGEVGASADEGGGDTGGDSGSGGDTGGGDSGVTE